MRRPAVTYAFTYDVPINAETYARIKEGIGTQRPDSLAIDEAAIRRNKGRGAPTGLMASRGAATCTLPPTA